MLGPVADQVSPYNLPIGRPGTTVVESGRLTDLRTGKFATVEDIAKAADNHLFVFLGEEHATEPDQLMHADVIQALVKRGRRVIVGLETGSDQLERRDLMDWEQTKRHSFQSQWRSITRTIVKFSRH